MSVVGETQGQGGTYKGLAALFGDPKDQLALSIFSLLPWLCLHFQHTPFTPVAQACIKVRCNESAAVSHTYWCHLLKHERYANWEVCYHGSSSNSQLSCFVAQNSH